MSNSVKRPRILMIAFACNPAGGGEHWLGWGWAEQAAKFCDVTLLTWDRFSREIERQAPVAGVRAVCVGVPAWVNWLGDRSGAGRWLRQVVWHRRAAAIAARLHAEEPFALVHQTTFHTFRIPFRAASWGIPAVWGPVAGGEACPKGFGAWLGNLRTVESSRHFTNRLALAQPAVRRSLRAAQVIFVSNQTTLNFLPEWCRARCRVVPPNALRDDPPPPPLRPRDPKAPLNILFVGNCVATRSMPLVFEALKNLPALPWRLTVVGGGSALEVWKASVRQRGLGANVVFTGSVPRGELPGHYERADVFVFPALRDSGGSGLLEAMSAGLPVVCCDWGGPAEMIDEGSGIKVSVGSPQLAIAGFTEAFKMLSADPQRRAVLGRGAYERARKQFSWDTKREILETTYAACLGPSR
ncbi:MAG: Alpha-D-kanosaminyltransferase [Pedosphaera sp.]|nr:Alpha-D-kanosaminyltransferase [Pedosphaera sp.]